MSVGSRTASQVFTRQQIAAVLILTIGGGLIRALQPLLLGALVHEGHLTIVELGWAATLEFVAIAITIGVAATWLKPERLRAISAVTVITFVIFNVASVFTSSYIFLLMRALNGVSSGIILWILFGMVARCNVPARVMGLYIGSNAGVALVLASFCSWYIMPTFGGRGGFLVVSLACAALIFCVPFMPSRFGPLAVEQADRRWPGVRGLVALIAVFAYAIGIMALWVYVDPLARRSGLDDGIIGYAITTSLAMQVVGGWCASYFGRLNPSLAIIISCCINIAVLGFLLVGGPAPIFVAALAIFGFLWAFIMSFITPFVMNSDPTGRAVMLIGTAELLGAAAGPALVTAFVAANGPQAAPVVSATLFAAGALIGVALLVRRGRVAAYQSPV